MDSLSCYMCMCLPAPFLLKKSIPPNMTQLVSCFMVDIAIVCLETEVDPCRIIEVYLLAIRLFPWGLIINTNLGYFTEQKLNSLNSLKRLLTNGPLMKTNVSCGISLGTLISWMAKARNPNYNGLSSSGRSAVIVSVGRSVSINSPFTV